MQHFIIERHYAVFTFSSRQHETRREWERYICLVSHTLDLFLSHLVALGNMSVNHTQVRKPKCLTSLSKLLWVYSHSVLEYILVSLVSQEFIFKRPKLSHFLSSFTTYLLWLENFLNLLSWKRWIHTSNFKRYKKHWKVDQVQLLLLIAGVFVATNRVLSFTLARRLNSQRFSCYCESGLSSWLSCDFQDLHLSTLSCSSRTRVWMSTFVHISSHSQLPKSLECSGRECKPSIRIDTFSKTMTDTFCDILRYYCFNNSLSSCFQVY